MAPLLIHEPMLLGRAVSPAWMQRTSSSRTSLTFGSTIDVILYLRREVSLTTIAQIGQELGRRTPGQFLLLEDSLTKLRQFGNWTLQLDKMALGIETI
jgi:hypothetical protein